VWFSDAACTQPVLSAEPHVLEQGYVYSSRDLADACGYSVETYEPVDVMAKPTSMTVYSGEGGDCWESGTAPVVAAQRMDDDAWVGGVEVVHPKADGLATVVLEASDGAVALLGARDTVRDESCGVNEELGRCTPVNAGWLPEGEQDNRYDAGCTNVVGEASHCGDTTVLVRHGTCGPEYFEAGDLVAPEDVSWVDEGVCQSAELDDGDHYRRGDAIPTDAFPEVTVALQGDGPVHGRVPADAQGTLLGELWPFAVLYDSEWEGECYPIPLSSEDFRCVPLGPHQQVIELYADAGCTMPVVRLWGSSCGPQQPPPTALVLLDENFQYVQHVYALGEEYEGPLYRQSGDTCSPEKSVDGPTYRHVGAAVALDELPTLTLTIDD
jgi:hypothetical protein